MIGGCAFAVDPAQAFAPAPAVVLTGGQTTSANDSWTLGWQLSVNKRIIVDSLGAFDGGTTGLNGVYSLGLWDASQNLLAFTSVSAIGDSTADSFVWKKLANSVTLSPGF